MARTAVVAGTATAVSGRVARRQQNKWQQKADAEAYQNEQAAPAEQAPPPQQYQQAPPQYQQAPPQYQQAPVYQQAPPQYQQAPAADAPASDASAGTNLVDEIQKLAALKDQGILSEAEFTAAKNKLLGI
jgi:Short C-terminal domain